MAKKKAPEALQDTAKPTEPKGGFLHCRMRPVDLEMIDSLVDSLDAIDRTTLVRQLVKEAYAKEQKRVSKGKAK